MPHPQPARRAPSHTASRRFRRGVERLALGSLTLLGAVVAGACVHGSPGRWHLGSELEHERVVEFAPRLGDGVDLEFELGVGDFRVVRVDGPSRLVATIHEEVPGTAELFFDGGRLVLSSPRGDDALLGELLLELGHDVRSIDVDLGAGDLTIDGVGVRDHVTVSSGAGSVTLIGLGAPARVELALSVGDLLLASFEAGALTVDQGLGDARLEGLDVELLRIDAGLGSITLANCRVDDLRADAGIGDITVSESEVRRHSVAAGIGSVHLVD